MSKVATGVLLFLSGVVLVLSIVSTATSSWIVSQTSKFGLWELCIDQACSFITNDLVPWQMWFTRVFMITGALTLSIVCILITPVLCQCTESSVHVVKGIVGGFVISAIEFMVAMALFTSGATIVFGVTWGYSFVLGWLSSVFCIILAIVAAAVLSRSN